MAYSPSIFFLLSTKLFLILLFAHTHVKADLNAAPTPQLTFQLFFHEYSKPPNATIIKVATSQSNSSSRFDDIDVIDYKVTNGRNPDTLEVG
ncbi:hypothetical protein HPP92_017652 [Vanilla planifolia]|uniref:Dirigent protein n=1 Tax=Vanilla planifolia TaxID=51239 RepID=A0A835UM50_VANPL|nr:hypothetical protein HPP92_017652 [Vanilla planifolia]